jgi:hypothetical protein
VASRHADQVIINLGARQHGLLTSTQAWEGGVSEEELRHRVRQGWVVRVVRGLYRLRDHPWTRQSELQAAVLLAGARAVVSHGAAARAHGFWAYRDHAGADVTVKEGSFHRQRLGRLHISSWLPPSHVLCIDGIPTTTVARTCFDLAGDVPPPLRTEVGREVHAKNIGRVFNDALRNRGLSMLHEVAVLAALAGRGRSGTVLVRSIVDELGDEYEPTDSDGEDLFLEVVSAFGLPAPRVHVVVSDAGGFIGELDTVFEGWLNVEIDGMTHDGPLDRRRDRERDARLTALGYRVERVKYRQRLLVDPGRVARDVLRRLAEGRD